MPVKRQASTLFPGEENEYGSRSSFYPPRIAGPPNKLAKQLQGISLNDAKHSYGGPNSASGSRMPGSDTLLGKGTTCNIAAADPNDSAEMDGAEGKDFTYINRRELNDSLNEVEIDDRFTRIPDFIRDNPPRQSTPPPPLSPKDNPNALILYSERSQRPGLANLKRNELRKRKLSSTSKRPQVELSTDDDQGGSDNMED